MNNSWWRINVIRDQSFGRKVVRTVLDSSILSKTDTNNMEIIPNEIFFKSGNYLMVECEQNSESICNFLIFYQYRNLQYGHIIEYDYVCQNNNYPDLFQFVLFMFCVIFILYLLD